MISCANVAGGLANQMFQYAAGYAQAKKMNVDFFYPEKPKGHDGRSPNLHNIFNLSAKRQGVHGPSCQEAAFHFNQIPPVAFLTLQGYYQSEKYFKDFESEIRSEFTFIDPCDIHPNPKTVSIHVRRSDYVPKPNYHPLCSMDYYEKAMSLFGEDYSFLVFSDDIPWCRDNFKGPRFSFSEGLTNSQDLELMSKCDHHIIANSSFSWWASWLNQQPDKKTIAPSKWFGPAYNGYSLSDLYLDDWVVI